MRSFLPPFGSVLLQWLEELAHAVASGRGSTIRKAIFLSDGIHRFLDCTIDYRHLTRRPVPISNSPCLSTLIIAQC